MAEKPYIYQQKKAKFFGSNAFNILQHTRTIERGRARKGFVPSQIFRFKMFIGKSIRFFFHRMKYETLTFVARAVYRNKLIV